MKWIWNLKIFPHSCPLLEGEGENGNPDASIGVLIPTGLTGDHYFNWIPSTRKILFDARDEQDKLVIWEMDVDYKIKKKILTDHINIHPCSSPDGKCQMFHVLNKKRFFRSE